MANMKVEIPLQGGLKTAAGSTEPVSARHGNCLSDKKEECELSAEAASFVLIHTIFKPLLHCDRCTIPTTRAYRECSTTPSKLNPNSRETTHATSGKNVPIKQKKVNSRLQRLALGNKIHFSKKKKRTVYHLSGNRSDKQEGKCRAVKSTAERVKTYTAYFITKFN